jgi:hypothetical protein
MLCGAFTREQANNRVCDLVQPVAPSQEKHKMGLTPEGGNPFTKIDKQSVIGTLKATGSRDSDILYAQKAKLLAPNKNLKILSYILIGGGALLSLTVILAIAGIPLALFGVWIWRFSSKNIEAIETGYNEYLTSSPA